MFTDEQLQRSDFDEKAYLRYVLHASGESAAGERRRLDACMEKVKASIQELLTTHAEGMIDHVIATNKAQHEVLSAMQAVSSLATASGRLRLMIEEPYRHIRDKLAELRTTHDALHLLRAVQDYLGLLSRLQEQVRTNDLLRAARTLQEMTRLQASTDMRGIDVAESATQHMERLGNTVRSRAHELLAMRELLPAAGTAALPTTTTITTPQQQQQSHMPGQGEGRNMTSVASAMAMSQLVTNVSTALQCFSLLGSLPRTVTTFMTEHKREVLKGVMRELDAEAIVSLLSAAAAPAGVPDRPTWRGSTTNNNNNTSAGELAAQRTQALLLTRIQQALFLTVQHTQCVILLWRLLLSQHGLHESGLEQPVRLLVEYWGATTEQLQLRLAELDKRPALHAALIQAYPRYHTLLCGFLSRTPGRTTSAGVHSGSAFGSNSSNMTTATATLAGMTGFVPTDAMSLAALNVRQCGMGDLLDLIDLVERTMSAGNRAAAAAAVPTNTSALRRAWVGRVSAEVAQAFAAQLLDRHRQPMGQVLSRLSMLTPTSAVVAGQAIGLRAMDLRRQPSHGLTLRPEASTIAVSQYTQLALQDVHLYRQEPAALQLTLECITTCVSQMVGQMKDAVVSYPLPPLPSIAADLTRAQLLHLSIANACTTLVQDLVNMLALLPEVVPSHDVDALAIDSGANRTHSTATATVTTTATTTEKNDNDNDDDDDVFAALAMRRRQLARWADELTLMAAASTQPFLRSAAALLLPNIAHYVLTASEGGGGGGAEQSQQQQLRSHVQHFLSSFYFLVEPRTSGWAELTRHTADTMLARLLVTTALTLHKTKEATSVQAEAGRLQRVMQEVTSVVIADFVHATQTGGMGRSTLLVKSALRQVELLYTTPDILRQASLASLVELLRPLPAALAQLLLLQQLSWHVPQTGTASSAEGSEAAVPHTVAELLHMPLDTVTEAIEAAVMVACEPASQPQYAAALSHLPAVTGAMVSAFTALSREPGATAAEACATLRGAWQALMPPPTAEQASS